MIIWGSRTSESNVAEDEFFCPSCRTNTYYIQRRVSTYFTLYFIPLFPINNHGEYIQCQNCGGDFDVSVADMPREQLENLTRPWTCSHCGNSNPAEYQECLSCNVVRSDHIYD